MKNSVIVVLGIVCCLLLLKVTAFPTVETLETIKFIEDTGRVELLESNLSMCEEDLKENTQESIVTTGTVESGAVETVEFDVRPIFKDKRNDFSKGRGGQSLRDANSIWINTNGGFTTGYIEFSVTTSEKDKKRSRKRSSFYLAMQNEQGEYIGGHLADFVITEKDYEKVFTVQNLDSVRTYMYMGDMKAKRNNSETTDFLGFINRSKSVKVIAFYNATEYASIQSLSLFVK